MNTMHTNGPSGDIPENIDEAKLKQAGKLKYRLTNANVYCSSEGFHFIDYLDPTAQVNPEIDGSSLSQDEVSYIEKSLQSNRDKFRNQIDLVQGNSTLSGTKLLDIGSGGGFFFLRL